MAPNYLTSIRQFDESVFWWVFIQRKLRSAGVTILEVVAKYTSQVRLINNDDVLKSISANGANNALNIRILPRTSRCWDHILDIQTINASSNGLAIDAISVL